MNLQGSPIDYLIVFFAGILASLTPCIYPLIPVTVSIIGIDSRGRRATGFILSFIYVTGIAFVYSILGLIAALTGSIFGSISVHPITRVAVGVIFIFFGLSLWEIFPLKTLGIKANFSFRARAPWQVFLLGLSSGLVISPCTSPILGSILVLAASRSNIVYAITLLLTFAYGLGAILILAGTFSSVIISLPKSAAWMSKIKFLGGLILILVGVYFIFIALY